MHSRPRLPCRRDAPRRLAATRARGTLLAILWAALITAACSTVPERRWPPRLVGEIEVIHEAGGAIEVPASDAEFTVLELVADPPPLAERFDGDRRIWVLPEGGASILCRYRVFGDPARRRDPFADAPRADDRFPGARVVRHSALTRPAPGGGDARW